MIGKKFEEQVEQTPHHTAVKTGNQWVTYKQLNRYANRIASMILEQLAHTGTVERVSLLFDHGLHMIAAILGAFKAGMAYVPLSTDYPENRLSYMVGNSGSLLVLALSCHEVTARTIAQNNNIECLFIDEPGDRFSEENPGLDVPGSQLAYIMYTSGSTGRPKGVMQTHENVLYYIRNWVKIFSITSSDGMTLFSSFCHDGSVQDLLAALLTGAALFPLNMRNRESTVELSDFLVRERITIWHSVPSLYSYFVSTLTGKEKFPYLRYVLLGGEAVRQHEIIMFKRFFPHSVLANVYGQTESSVNSIRLIHQEDMIEHMTIGDPLDRTQVLVLDEDDCEVEEFEVGEIMVACQHLSTGYWKNPEETKRIFSYDPEMGPLYFTGDLGRLLPGGEIEFLGRRDFQVKIRGFRIEMGEIESQVLKHPGIHEAVVTVRENEEGEKELCCYYIPRVSQAQREPGGDVEKPGDLELREFLAGELPDYMIPTYFVPLERFPLTQSGKIDRSALPEPKAAEIPYVAPRNELEKTLVNLWCTVLCKDADQVGIDANFFQLGGHSLKATALVAKIHKTLDIRVPVVQIFKTPTVRGLAAYIKSVREDKFISIEPAPLKEYYPLSSAQKRLYILQQMDETGIGYNMPGVFLLEGDLDGAKLEGAFKRLIEQHESLRTSFHMIEEEPVQRVQKKIDFKGISKKDLGRRRQIDIALDEIIKAFVRSFDLSKAPLLRAGLMELEPGKHLLMIDMHHIISDGISFIIVLRDLLAFYSGKSLAPLRIQYKDYCQWQLGSREMEIRKKQADFWINTFSKEIPVLNLPSDFPRPAVQRFEGRRQGFTLDKEVTKRLKEVALSGEATLFMILLAVFNAFLSKMTGQEDIVAGTVVSGRDHSELQPIVGMFVNTLALRNYPCEEKTFSQFLKEVKTTALAAFENRSYPFEDLVEQVTIKRDISRNPIFDVMFRLQNFDVEGEEEEITELESEEGLRLKPWDFNKTTSPFDLTLIGVEVEAHLYFKMEYSTNLFKEETISRFIGYFKRIALSASKNPHEKLSQLEIMEEEEKQRILYEFNDTALEYPAEKTIHQLFEEQMERTPDHIAVVGAHELHELHEEGTRGLAPLFIPISITYRKLNEQSNQLAHLLRQKGVGPDILVGLMVERSVEMIIGLLGILKAGGAYVPIDPGYPLTRIEYIIKTSGTVFFLTSGTGTAKLEKISYNGCKVDLLDPSIYNKSGTGKKENPGDI
ncbi:MAG: amino acid adenylation domain-containing protein, partial [Candidatus Aminicenantes bacterium]